MKKQNIDNLIHKLKHKPQDELYKRAEKSAHHILASLAFQEVSKECYYSTNSILLSPVGLYYSIFHLSISLCYINPFIELKELKRIRHSNLYNLINTHLVNKSFLKPSFSELFIALQEDREWLNYSFQEFKLDLFDEFESNILLFEKEFKSAIYYMDVIFEKSNKIFDFRERIKLYIGDSKGEDLLDTYLSKNLTLKIEPYLLQYNLTT